jgi:hypothetical protein
LFFVKKSVAETDRRAGALSWRRKHTLLLHFLGISFWSHPKPKK